MRIGSQIQFSILKVGLNPQLKCVKYKNIQQPRERKSMFGKGGMGNLMKQAQQMQEQMAKVQEEIANMEVVGVSGAGLVKVTMSGNHSVRRIDIDSSLISDEDKEMLEDLIAAAVNDANARVETAQKEKMADIGGGMSLPPGFKMPF